MFNEEMLLQNNPHTQEETEKHKKKPSPTSSLVTTSVGIATSKAGFATLCEKYRINEVRVSL